MRPVFVIGSPRSGTTVIGRFVGSDPMTLDLGEYFAHYFAAVKAPDAFARVPSDFSAEFLSSLWSYSTSFAFDLVRKKGCQAFVDSTPWNLLIADRVGAAVPKAIFILLLRGWQGVCQSLARSYMAGYRWAGATTKDRAAVWVELYSHMTEVPAGRTIAVSYDLLCEAPEKGIIRLLAALRELGGPCNCDFAMLSRSHANGDTSRPTFARIGDDGQTEWTGCSPFDQASWQPTDQEQIPDEVYRLWATMKKRFPEALRDGVQIL